jgi:hypothetical protein
MAAGSERPPPKREGPAGGRGDLSDTWNNDQVRAATPERQGSRLKLLEWHPVRRNTLHGFAIVELPSGIVIRELSVHEKAGKRWVSMPAKPVLGQDGRQVENHAHKNNGRSSSAGATGTLPTNSAAG